METRHHSGNQLWQGMAFTHYWVYLYHQSFRTTHSYQLFLFIGYEICPVCRNSATGNMWWGPHAVVRRVIVIASPIRGMHNDDTTNEKRGSRMPSIHQYIQSPTYVLCITYRGLTDTSTPTTNHGEEVISVFILEIKEGIINSPISGIASVTTTCQLLFVQKRVAKCASTKRYTNMREHTPKEIGRGWVRYRRMSRGCITEKIWTLEANAGD